MIGGACRKAVGVIGAALLLAGAGGSQAEAQAADGSPLRAAYLATNPAHAVTDPATGQARGVVIDLVNELGRRRGVDVRLLGLQSPQNVIDAVRNGEADIGFVAYNSERAGPVEFTDPYVLVQQTFLVPSDSTIRSVGDIDRAGLKLGAGRADSIALYLGRTLQNAELVELTGVSREQVLERLRAREVDAFGANRQRLTDYAQGADDIRLLPDDLYGVEQTIVVPAGDGQALAAMNRFIDDVQSNGFLAAAITRSGVIGISAAARR